MDWRHPNGHYRSYTDQRDTWAEAAAAKLRADVVDASDDAAVRACLSECVGWPRLYEFWREVHGPRQPRLL